MRAGHRSEFQTFFCFNAKLGTGTYYQKHWESCHSLPMYAVHCVHLLVRAPTSCRYHNSPTSWCIVIIYANGQWRNRGWEASKGGLLIRWTSNDDICILFLLSLIVPGLPIWARKSSLSFSARCCCSFLLASRSCCSFSSLPLVQVIRPGFFQTKQQLGLV